MAIIYASYHPPGTTATLVWVISSSRLFSLGSADSHRPTSSLCPGPPSGLRPGPRLRFSAKSVHGPLFLPRRARRARRARLRRGVPASRQLHAGPAHVRQHGSGATSTTCRPLTRLPAYGGSQLHTIAEQETSRWRCLVTVSVCIKHTCRPSDWVSG